MRSEVEAHSQTVGVGLVVGFVDTEENIEEQKTLIV